MTARAWIGAAVLCACDAGETASGGATSCEPSVEQACYPGPEGTEGVGACRAGVRVCLSHGRGFSPCEGAVAPAPEDCTTAEDDNCDGITTCGDTLWSTRLGTEEDEAVVDLAADAQGQLFLIGNYRASLDLGGGALTSTGTSRDVFVAKTTADGAHLWSLGIHADESLTARAVAVGPHGEVAAGFGARAAVSVDGGPALAAAGLNDVGILRLDARGAVVDASLYGDDGEQQPSGVAFDEAGDLVVTGFFRGSIDFGLGALDAFDTQHDAFVVKLGADGRARWSTSFFGADDDIPRALAIDPGDGSIYVAGEAQYDLTIGENETSGSADRDAFIAKLDAGGEVAWSHRWGDDRDQEAYGLAVDAQGNVVVVGGFSGSMDIGAVDLVSPGADGIFIVKLDRDGAVAWGRAFGGGASQRAYDVTFDSRGRIVVSGFYEGFVSIADAALPEGGVSEPCMLILKLEPDGTVLWSRGVPVQGDQSTGGAARAWRGLALAPDDRVWFAGYVEGPLDLGGGALEPLGGTDVVVALLSP